MTAARTTAAARYRALLTGPGRDGLESVSVDSGARRPDDVTDRVESILKQTPEDEVGDPREFQQALDTLLRHTRRATQSLFAAAPLSNGDLHALEAVVITDGTRPALLLRGDTVDPQHPMAGDWGSGLTEIEPILGQVAQAVGRIEPEHATASSYFGTGWVVDREHGLVLTNLHVLEEIGRRFPDVVVRSGQGFQILDAVYIDFVRETGTARTNRFRVVEATPSRTDPADKARLDAAVLRIEPTEPGQAVPQAISLQPDVDGPQGNLEPAYLIGFPGPPSFFGRGDDDVNWTKVYQVLFGNRYGVKRLAPGKVNNPLGSLDRDPGNWIFGHDATTLGGSSGSPVMGVIDGALTAYGLHFSGKSEVANRAHAFSESAAQLRAIGVPVPA
jgi:hypothetical protein